MRKHIITFVLIFSMVSGFLGSGCGQKMREMTFGGGPAGGVFTLVARGMADLFHREIPSTQLVVNPSGGSPFNLARIDSGKLDMGIAYSGDIERGKLGLLMKHSKPLSSVRAIARLYGAQAHLVVLKRSRIRTLADLNGARVAIGLPGSGTAALAQHFLEHLGLWDKIEPEYASYDLVEHDFISEEIHAVWELVGHPAKSLERISRKIPIRLIELGGEARGSGFLERNPVYSPSTIPAGTYQGVDYAVETFEDQAIWVAANGVNEDFIYQALSSLFSPKGLEHMKRVHHVGLEMRVNEVRKGVTIPFHPGAVRFWKQQHSLPANEVEHEKQ